jgi:uncharacterized protein (UPF0548 family)
MRLVLSRRPPGPKECAWWLGKPASSPPEGFPTGMYDRHESSVHCRRDESADAAFERIREQLFAYDIFPATLMHFAFCPGNRIELHGLIVQRAGIGPIRLESAVRVVDVWDTETVDGRDAGFRYVTLAGHPERGVASFAVRRDSSGGVHVILDARSQPGTLIARLGRPVARRVQVAATRAAVKRLAGRAGLR